MKKKFLDYQLRIENVKETVFEDEKKAKDIENQIIDQYGIYDLLTNDNQDVIIAGKIIRNTKAECKAEYTLAKGFFLQVFKKYGCKKVTSIYEAHGDKLW